MANAYPVCNWLYFLGILLMFSSSILLVVTATKDPATLPSRVSDKICLTV